jgi:hypothetical protein
LLSRGYNGIGNILGPDQQSSLDTRRPAPAQQPCNHQRAGKCLV